MNEDKTASAVQSLRDTVALLLRDIERLRAEVRDLERENDALRRRLREGGR